MIHDSPDMNFMMLFQIVCLTTLTMTIPSTSRAATKAPDHLRWHQKEDQVDANIHSWSLERLLENISRATGWEVYVEPDTDERVSAKFTRLPKGKALRRLLGDLNYAIIPQSGRGAKLLIYRTDMGAATRRIKALEAILENEKKERAIRIANELIVKADGETDIEALARRLGGQIIGSVDGSDIHRLRFEDEDATEKALREINSTEGVDAEANYAVPPPPRPEGLPSGSALPFTLNPPPSGDGSELVIGLIDTAVQAEGSRIEKFLLPVQSTQGEVVTPTDQPTHGTSMADTILRGISMALPEGNETSSVRILPVDVYGANEISSTFDVAHGISMAIENGAHVINLSLGGTGDTEYLHSLIKNASNNGVVFIASAGNEPVTYPTYPAAYPEVLAVTAGDRNGELAPYANRGGFVDVIAPGGNIVSYAGSSFFISGTSPASALTSGMVIGVAEGNGSSVQAGIDHMQKRFPFTGQ